MRKTGRYLLVSALALIVLAVVLHWRTGRANEAHDIKLAGWGHGDLKTSEEAYYGDRISAIVDAWMKMGQRADHDQEGRLRAPYHTFLVLDCDHREIRIEEDGQVLEEYRSELPRQMTWTVYHDGGNGASPLGPLVRLRYRGIDSARQDPEIVWLTGQRPDECLAFHFTCRDQGRTRIHGRPFRAYHSPPARKEGVAYYGSILVNDAEYEQARRPAGEARTTGPASLLRPAQTGCEENRAAWSRVQKKLYQVIEGQVLRAGFRLRQLRVVPGPDYSAAHAEMQVSRYSLLRDILGGLVSGDPYLLIDCLGDGIWYAKLVPNPQRPALRPKEVDLLAELPLEFLVATDQVVPSSARQEWIAKGREKQRQSTESRAEWTATLPNGVVVTLIGVCESPSEGKRWWGPDGSSIDYAPRFARELTTRDVGDRRVFEIAWRVQHPDGNRLPMSIQHVFEDALPFDSRESGDRYGVVRRDTQHCACSFEKSQERTTLRVGADLGNQGVCSVRFKNISLVPGTNQRFEIEVEK